MNGKILQIDTGTRLCAVIGNPVAHSLSPRMHNAAFAAAGLNYVYVAFQVTDVEGCLRGMRALPSFRGMSVTIPHKMAVMPYLDEMDAMSHRVGCVNTITQEAGRLSGTVTDGLGALRAITGAGVSLQDRRVAFLGAGGAVRAVAFALADAGGLARLSILGRTASRVEALANDLRRATPAPVHTGDLGTDLERAIKEHDVLIQGTPMGMHGHDPESTLVPAAWLRPDHVVFDMVYRPIKTRLIRDAEKAGCNTIAGLEMLLYQAILQFETWTGVPAPRTVMREALLAGLSEN